MSRRGRMSRRGIGSFSGGGEPPPPAFDENTATLKLDTFAADGTWTRPALDTFWGLTGDNNHGRVEIWSGGAGGALNVGGGGGPSYARVDNLDLSGSATQAVVGLAGAAIDTDAVDATFGTTLVVADGPLSGTNGGTGGQAANCTGDAKFSGGDGGKGTGNQVGGAGAGSTSSGSGGTPGAPEGSFGAAGVAGRPLAGGGSQTAVGLAGGRGQCVAAYNVTATAGFPRLRGYGTSRTSTGLTHNVTPVATAGQKIALWVVVDTDATVTTPDATEVVTAVNGTTVRGSVFRRTATGSDAITFTTSASVRVTMTWWVFSDAGDPEATLANGSSTNADPPSHTSSGGAVNGLWLTCGGWDGSALIDVSAPPANYTGMVLCGPVFSNGVYSAFAMRELNAASEDPGAFTSGSEQWVAATILIPPA